MPVRGHSWDYWQKKLMDEQGYDEETANKVIGSWEKEESTEADPCWDGYEQIGMKDKDGKQVPNCVPKSDETSLNTTDDQDDSKSLSTKSRGMYEEGIVDKIENLADKFGIKLDRDEEQIDDEVNLKTGESDYTETELHDALGHFGIDPSGAIGNYPEKTLNKLVNDWKKESSESRANEIMMRLGRKMSDEDLLGGIVMDEINQGDPNNTIRDWYKQFKNDSEQADNIASVKRMFEQRGISIESKSESNEEGMASVSGPPAGTEPTVIEDEEALADTRVGGDLGKELGDTQVESHDPIMLNENYLQYENVLYRPVYAGESIDLNDDSILIYENKYYTSEGTGNCPMCKGAGKVTVERLGLKECPKCDGSGDIQEQPQEPQMQQPEIPQEQLQESKANETYYVEWANGGFFETEDMDEAKQKAKDNDGKVFLDDEQVYPAEESKANENKEWECKDCGVKTSNPTQHQKDTGHNNIEKIPSFGGCINCGSPVQEPYYMEDYVDCKNCGAHFKFLEAKSLESKAKESWFKDKGDSTTCLLCGKSMVSSMKSEHMIHHKIGESLVEDENYNKKFIKAVEACGCKKNAYESIKKYKSFIDTEINVLKKRAKAGEAVGVMYGLPTIRKNGRKIKGTLAYAGVSLNDRIYLPEELAKGHGKTLPLLLNHSSIAGAEDELDRLDDEMLDHLENEKDYQVGEVTLTWDPQKLTLFYEGVVENEFFQKEIDDMNMAVSLGIYYDSDSPKVCDEECYTLIKGAEFREVSLVYHAGFPIATIEAVEAELKRKSKLSIAKEEMDQMLSDGSIDTSPSDSNYIPPPAEFDSQESIAEEEEDPLPKGGSIDAEPKPPMDTPVFVESFYSPNSFSIRGVSGMTISNSNGVERYSFDPTQNFSTNMVHFSVVGEGATIFGEQLQPKMTTSDDVTKEIESKPKIEVKDSDEDILKKN